MKDNINSEEIFTLIPENLIANNRIGFTRIGNSSLRTMI